MSAHHPEDDFGGLEVTTLGRRSPSNPGIAALSAYELVFELAQRGFDVRLERPDPEVLRKRQEKAPKSPGTLQPSAPAFGNLLRILRDALLKKFSQTQIAQSLGVSQTHVSRLLAGQRGMSLAQARTLVELSGNAVDAVDLIEEIQVPWGHRGGLCLQNSRAWKPIDAAQLNAAIEKSGLSKVEIAQRAGLAPAHLSRIIHGKSKAGRKTTLALREVLSIEDADAAPQKADSACAKCGHPMPMHGIEGCAVETGEPGTGFCDCEVRP